MPFPDGTIGQIAAKIASARRHIAHAHAGSDIGMRDDLQEFCPPRIGIQLHGAIVWRATSVEQFSVGLHDRYLLRVVSDDMWVRKVKCCQETAPPWSMGRPSKGVYRKITSKTPKCIHFIDAKASCL